MGSPTVLYVKSEKIYQTQYTMPHKSGGGHWCSAGYRATQTNRIYSEEDKQAMQLLENANMNYRLVDLSDTTAISQLKARIRRVNKTPTLIHMGRMHKGLEEIKAAVTS